MVAGNFLKVFQWLVKPLFWWVSSRTTQEDLKTQLELDSAKPIVYVLPKKSLVDLLVLLYHCKRSQLPLPLYRLNQVKIGIKSSYLYLARPGVLYTKRAPLLPFLEQLRQLEKSGEKDIQLVPVSVFWGKDPGREEESIFKLLFGDRENAGVLQKILIVLAQGRNNIVHFGKPVSLRRVIFDDGNLETQARKLRRILRVHFRTQRNAILGKKLYNRDQVIYQITHAEAVKSLIEEESKKKKSSKKKLHATARRYAREICADQTYSIVRLLELVFRRIWNRMYEGVEIQGLEKVRAYADRGYEVIYVPNHRSHLDYLLINYCVYVSGLPPPHTAAGVNLNFWPIGGILRRGGAFFMKRSFAGNRLYTAVFTSYLDYLLNSGFHISFFPEGGRSRTGRLLPLKTGFLSMILQTAERRSRKPIVLIPMYVGYDKVIEVRSYMKELSGATKRRESLSRLFKSLQIVKKYWGRVYLSVGDPIELDQRSIQVGGTNVPSGEHSSGLHEYAKVLAREVGEKINSSVIVTSPALVSLAILSAGHRAMPKDELIEFLDLLRTLGRGLGFEKFPLGPAEDMVENMVRLDIVRVFEHPGGDVLYFSETDGIINSYYKNNIVHIYALPALVSKFFQFHSRLSREVLLQGCEVIYALLQEDFFIPAYGRELREKVLQVIADMAQLGLLEIEGGEIVAPALSSRHSDYLEYLGRFLGLEIERYAIILSLLASIKDHGSLKASQFEKLYQKMAQRHAILTGAIASEAADAKHFSNAIKLLRKLGFIPKPQDGDQLAVGGEILRLVENTKLLLSPKTLYSIERLSEKGS